MTGTLLKKIESTRRADTRVDATAEAGKERAAEHRRREQIRERNCALWAEHFYLMAASHRKLSEDYEGRARALLGEMPNG